MRVMCDISICPFIAVFLGPIGHTTIYPGRNFRGRGFIQGNATERGECKMNPRKTRHEKHASTQKLKQIKGGNKGKARIILQELVGCAVFCWRRLGEFFTSPEENFHYVTWRDGNMLNLELFNLLTKPSKPHKKRGVCPPVTNWAITVMGGGMAERSFQSFGSPNKTYPPPSLLAGRDRAGQRGGRGRKSSAQPRRSPFPFPFPPPNRPAAGSPQPGPKRSCGQSSLPAGASQRPRPPGPAAVPGHGGGGEVGYVPGRKDRNGGFSHNLDNQK